MKYPAYITSIILLLSLQVGLFGYLKISSAAPNLLLLLVVSLSLEKEDYDFFFAALAAGLFLDFYSSAFPGSFAFGFLLAAYLVHLSAHSIVTYEINWKYLAGFLTAGMLLSYLWLWAYSAAVFRLGWWPERVTLATMGHEMLPEFFYNALLIYPLYISTRFVKRGLTRLFSRQQVIR